MKKLVFALFAMLLILSCAQAQSQNDFYGKWITQVEADKIGGGTMEWDISGKTFTAVWTPSWVTYASPVEQTVYEIFSWERIRNDNKDTLKDYPNGYLLGLRHGLGNTTSKLFMHRDKSSIISAYEDNRGGYHQEIYYKPCLQSDFYGTWEMSTTTKEGKTNTHLYTFTDKEYVTEGSGLTKTSYKVLLWKSIINTDNNTKADYPTGFIVIIKMGSDGQLTNKYYLHKNKKKLIYVWSSEYNFFLDKSK